MLDLLPVLYLTIAKFSGPNPVQCNKEKESVTMMEAKDQQFSNMTLQDDKIQEISISVPIESKSILQEDSEIHQNVQEEVERILKLIMNMFQVYDQEGTTRDQEGTTRCL